MKQPRGRGAPRVNGVESRDLADSLALGAFLRCAPRDSMAKEQFLTEYYAVILNAYRMVNAAGMSVAPPHLIVTSPMSGAGEWAVGYAVRVCCCDCKCVCHLFRRHQHGGALATRTVPATVTPALLRQHECYEHGKRTRRQWQP